MTEHTILGLDPGKTTGAVVIRASEEGWRLVERFDVVSVEHRGEALSELEDALLSVVCVHYNLDIVMENLLAYGKNTAFERIEAEAIIRKLTYECSDSDKDLNVYAPTTIRSVVIGNGKTDARTIRLTMRHLLRLPPTGRIKPPLTTHQQDALAAALCHMNRAYNIPIDRCLEGEVTS